MRKVTIAAGLFACMLMMGTSTDCDKVGGIDNNNNNNNPVDAAGMFDRVWKDVNERYAYFAEKGVDWDAVKTQYQGQFAGQMTESQFLAAIAPMLAELKDPSIALQDSQGKPVTVFAPAGAANYPATFRSAHFQAPAQMASSQFTSGRLPARYSVTDDHRVYWAIDNLNADEWTDSDGLFSCLRDMDPVMQKETLMINDGMIIDLRQTAPGGRREIAEILAGYFTESNVVYGYAKDRTVGTNHDAFKAFEALDVDSITTLGSSEIVFTNKVVVLVGRHTRGIAELFALMLAQCPNVTIMGEMTSGNTGKMQQFSLSNGIRYTIPVAKAYTPAKDALAGVGVAPDVAMDAAASFDAAHDFLLDAAWDELVE